LEELPESLFDGPEDEVEPRFYRWLWSQAGPDEWHRFALGANWDMHDPVVYEWVAAQPDCDKATALTLFWLAQPEYAAEHPDASDEHRALIGQIRDRWLSGGYSRSELAFEPGVDAWFPDFARLQQTLGDRAEEEMPSSMRISLPGRRLDLSEDIEGIPSRFWPPELR
jgi:hypothetical protein